MERCQICGSFCTLGATVFLFEPAPKNSLASSRLPIVAESPILRGLTLASLDKRSIKQKVCPPRSLLRNECNSSTTIYFKPPKRCGISMCLLIMKLSSDSGVICKIPEGCLSSLRFCVWATSPCQRQTGISTSVHKSVKRSYWSLINALSGAI